MAKKTVNKQAGRNLELGREQVTQARAENYQIDIASCRISPALEREFLLYTFPCNSVFSAVFVSFVF